MFNSLMPGTSTPGRSGSNAKTGSSCLPGNAAASTPSGVNSIAADGRVPLWTADFDLLKMGLTIAMPR
jgi:hypothetical protein